MNEDWITTTCHKITTYVQSIAGKWQPDPEERRGMLICLKWVFGIALVTYLITLEVTISAQQAEIDRLKPIIDLMDTLAPLLSPE